MVLTYDTDSARSQLVLVTGRVKDGSGMPLVGASVVVKDTMRGVSAGAEGNYRIFADPEATLVFSYIGYADREERIGTRSAIDVVLEEYEAVLEDVVVVGYGTQSRRTVTAAISKFDGHLLEGIPLNSVGDALKGRIPGVRVATTDATPGADPKFLIRGGSSINQSNDPIVLVDGVVREMAGLNPNDIESVSFLKDAAAAGIYGSRASNGVILITTKKGSEHLGPRIVFEGQWAWASPATKFDLMNAAITSSRCVRRSWRGIAAAWIRHRCWAANSRRHERRGHRCSGRPVTSGRTSRFPPATNGLKTR